LFLFFFIFLSARRPAAYQKRLWLPGWSVVYADAKNKKTPAGVSGGLLASKRHGLRGRPDFIYKKGARLVPVELKSAALNGAGPRDGDVMQLAAYFVIVGDAYGKKVPRGYLVYNDCVFKIKNTRRLRKKLFETINDMRAFLISGKAAAEPGFVKCRRCMCRGTVCQWNRP